MSRAVLSIAPWTRVADALDLAADWSVSHLPVLEPQRVVGMICVCDIEDAPQDAAVGGWVRRPIATISAGASIHEAACKMSILRVGSLLVMLEDHVVGIVTRGDLLRAGLSEEQVLGDRRCSACGDFHHTRAATVGRPSLCSECRERAGPAADERELGAGD
jgi:acetoin utilization protein AcuB